MKMSSEESNTMKNRFLEVVDGDRPEELLLYMLIGTEFSSTDGYKVHQVIETNTDSVLI